MDEHTAEIDAPVSWCRILRNGPPCPHLCADCKTANALLTPEERARILRSDVLTRVTPPACGCPPDECHDAGARGCYFGEARVIPPGVDTSDTEGGAT